MIWITCTEQTPKKWVNGSLAIFSSSYSTEQIPGAYRKDNFALKIKKRGLDDPSNYRSISLTLSKAKLQNTRYRTLIIKN